MSGDSFLAQDQRPRPGSIFLHFAAVSLVAGVLLLAVADITSTIVSWPRWNLWSYRSGWILIGIATALVAVAVAFKIRALRHRL